MRASKAPRWAAGCAWRDATSEAPAIDRPAVAKRSRTSAASHHHAAPCVAAAVEHQAVDAPVSTGAQLRATELCSSSRRSGETALRPTPKPRHRQTTRADARSTWASGSWMLALSREPRAFRSCTSAVAARHRGNERQLLHRQRHPNAVEVRSAGWFDPTGAPGSQEEGSLGPRRSEGHSPLWRTSAAREPDSPRSDWTLQSFVGAPQNDVGRACEIVYVRAEGIELARAGAPGTGVRQVTSTCTPTHDPGPADQPVWRPPRCPTLPALNRARDRFSRICRSSWDSEPARIRRLDRRRLVCFAPVQVLDRRRLGCEPEADRLLLLGEAMDVL